jgi:hypothetical protein
MNNPPPPQPETIMIEASAQNAINKSENNDEWEVAIPPIELEQGDEISVNQSFLEARGTSTEILEFSSSGTNQNNKQKLYYEFYASDDGTNDKNKGKDWWISGRMNYSANPPTTILEKESSHTYNPCKAFRYDRLWDETTINANGGSFDREVNGVKYNIIEDDTLNPNVANAFNITPREDYLVSGVFNSVDSIREIQDTSNAYKYIGGSNHYSLTNDQRTLKINDAHLNLDAFEYWEITMPSHDVAQQYSGATCNIKIPFSKSGSNYLAQFPVGTIIQLDWLPKRRQFSYPLSGTNPPLDATLPFDKLEEVEQRLRGVLGHYYISAMSEGTFLDNPIITPIDGGAITPANGQVITSMGFHGRPCYQLSIRYWADDEATVPNVAKPYLTALGVGTMAGNNFAGKKVIAQSETTNEYYINPKITNSRQTALGANMATTGILPINIFIRRSPLYIGSQYDNKPQPAPNVSLIPSFRCKNDPYRDEVNPMDAGILDLYPKLNAQEPDSFPLLVGQYHFSNTGNSIGTSRINPVASQPFVALTGTEGVGEIMDYWTANKQAPYNPLQTTLAVELHGDDAFIELNFPLLAGQAQGRVCEMTKERICSNTTILISSAVSEVVIVGSAYDFDMNKPIPTYKVEIIARNITQNNLMLLPFGGGQPLPQPLQVPFDPTDPVLWMDNSDYNPYVHDDLTYVTWWDFEEGKSLNCKIDPILLKKHLPLGLPVLKSNGYCGANEPIKNKGDFNPLVYNNEEYYSSAILANYAFGSNYFLYYNRTRTETPLVNPYSILPDNKIHSKSSLDITNGNLGSNKGCWLFNLTQAIQITSNETQFDSGMPPDAIPTSMTDQVKTSTNNAFRTDSNGGTQGYNEFNPHIYCYNMDFNFETEKLLIDIDGSGRVSVANFLIFAPDVIQQLTYNWNTANSLKHITQHGTDLLCGYVPLINEIEIETPKDYLTPTDLSSYWTEELHKLTNVKNLYDGAEIPNSSGRGLLQNPMLMAVFSTWGKYNYPTNTGFVNRDYRTFPMTAGISLGSVIFLDGNPMPTDWSFFNSDTYGLLNDETFPIYPRNSNNFIHLWDSNSKFVLPTYTEHYINHFTGLQYSNSLTTTWSNATGSFTNSDFPVSTSGLSNNQNLSNDYPSPNDAPTSGDASIVSAVNATNGGNNFKGEPQYALASSDAYDIWTANVSYPFAGAGQREDAIYRTTAMYPLGYLKNEKYANYLKISQYLGTDNFTLTYNTLVSAFEFQFAHQPYSTSFSVEDGNASGGDSAIRVFDHIPVEVSNWERYGGINMRNWAKPEINRGEFSYGEIENEPNWIIPNFPNGINPETSLSVIGNKFMDKLGYKLSQYNTTNGTIVKGIDGMGFNAEFPQLYIYQPTGTTGADPDVADAIINTTTSAEDNPNSEAHGGLGQLIFYPESADASQKTIRNTKNPTTNTTTPEGVRYDYCYTMLGQRGGLKTGNHNKAYGLPNIAGTPLVKDTLTFPITLNPDGEQRSGYTIEIGSSPLRASDLPTKLTDGYYYIVCPDLIDDPQFYISANNGSVIPAIAIISKTYVSGDFYTSFQSPITFYCKKAKIISSIRVMIRNSSMGIPSNLGGNSSVIFSIRRFNPTIKSPALTTSQQQALDYKALTQQTKGQQQQPTKISLLQQALGIGSDIIEGGDADDIGSLISGLSSILSSTSTVFQGNFVEEGERQQDLQQGVGGTALSNALAEATILDQPPTLTRLTTEGASEGTGGFGNWGIGQLRELDDFNAEAHADPNYIEEQARTQTAHRRGGTKFSTPERSSPRNKEKKVMEKVEEEKKHHLAPEVDFSKVKRGGETKEKPPAIGKPVQTAEERHRIEEEKIKKHRENFSLLLFLHKKYTIIYMSDSEEITDYSTDEEAEEKEQKELEEQAKRAEAFKEKRRLQKLEGSRVQTLVKPTPAMVVRCPSASITR